jgi:hypothetical protein
MRTLFFSSTAHDLVDLLRQRTTLQLTGLSADVGNAQFAAQLDAFDRVLILVLAPRRIRIDVIAVDGQ